VRIVRHSERGELKIGALVVVCGRNTQEALHLNVRPKYIRNANILPEVLELGLRQNNFANRKVPKTCVTLPFTNVLDQVIACDIHQAAVRSPRLRITSFHRATRASIVLVIAPIPVHPIPWILLFQFLLPLASPVYESDLLEEQQHALLAQTQAEVTVILFWLIVNQIIGTERPNALLLRWQASSGDAQKGKAVAHAATLGAARRLEECGN